MFGYQDAEVRDADQTTLAEKVAFLGQPAAYKQPVRQVVQRETHMSWVFLAGDRVFKLKKPVKFPYLDFSTLARREAACRAELALNRRLAPDVYLDVAALVVSPHGLSIGGTGVIVDWLVIMRRLDENLTLENMILHRRLEVRQLDQLASVLQRFYAHAKRVYTSPAAHIIEWQRSLAYNRRLLLDPRFKLSQGLVRSIDRVQRTFLKRRQHLLNERIRQRRIVDGHGDLRPEHIWLNDKIRIIDCLEFNPQLRAVDPFDEIAFLSLDCERLGAAWAGEYVRRALSRGLHDDPPEELYLFYRCHRATLRARLAIAHLLEPNPRTPEKWPRQAKAYLGIARRDASRLKQLIRTRQGL